MNLPTICAYLKLEQLPERKDIKRKGTIEQRTLQRFLKLTISDRLH